MGNTAAKLWCDGCQKYTPCRSIGFAEFGIENGRRFYKVGHTDVQWFRRARVCNVCGDGFVTAEVNEDLLSELVELREIYAEIQRRTKEFDADASKLGMSLAKLTASLKATKGPS